VFDLLLLIRLFGYNHELHSTRVVVHGYSTISTPHVPLNSKSASIKQVFQRLIRTHFHVLAVVVVSLQSAADNAH